MNIDFLLRHWALFAAIVLAIGIGIFVLIRLLEGSAQGRLGRAAATLRRRNTAARKAAAKVESAEQKVRQLRQRADAVKPRVLSEAEEVLQDARSLEKIADDQVLRARKAVREVIVEEFAPNRQDVLRKKYL